MRHRPVHELVSARRERSTANRTIPRALTPILPCAAALLACLLALPAHASEPKPHKTLPPSGVHMRRAGIGVTIFGALSLGAGTLIFGHATHGAAEPVGSILGPIPLVFGGGFVTMGALLIHFGEERRWAREDVLAGREPRTPKQRPLPGSGLLLAGPLTLAGGATMLTWGFIELTFTPTAQCTGYPYENCFSRGRAIAEFAGGGAGVLLGIALTAAGAHRRTQYIEWRTRRGNTVQVVPSPWASRVGGGLTLSGRF